MHRWVAALVLLLAAVSPAFAADYLKAVSDLPLADGLKEQVEKATVFDTPLGRIVNAYATGNLKPSAVLDFYDDTLPALGWDRQKAGTYHRKNEILKIDVWGPDEGPTNVSYTLSSQKSVSPPVSNTAFENLLVTTKGRVGLITLNRPKALNALCDALVAELGTALDVFEADPEIGAIVITGSEKAFAAGADIKEMKDRGFIDVYTKDFITVGWERVAVCRKPVIAAVAGFALGGGCEMAMMCDFIIAAETAKFGQPEITLGIIPGAGGTQRLARAVGKAKAMDLVLTGRMMDAAEAERAGLVARVVPAEKLLEEAMAAAEKIAGMSLPVAMLAKESLNRAFETTLAEGIRFERRMFHASFATEDQKEGMAAFVDKRKPAFKNR